MYVCVSDGRCSPPDRGGGGGAAVAAPAARTAAAGRVPARRRGQRPPFTREWAAGWCGPRSRKSKRGGHGCPKVSGCTCTRPHRRSELVALTLDDVTLHATDGLHVRLRRSKTDQEARGTVKALPYGRDPVTCPPCAYVRWRQVLHAWDTAADGAGRRAVLPVLRRQALVGAGNGGEEEPVLHCCRSTRLPTAGSGRGVVPDGAQERRDRRPGDVWRRDRRDDPAPRRPGWLRSRPDAAMGGHALGAGFVTEAFRAGADAHATMRQTGHRSARTGQRTV